MKIVSALLLLSLFLAAAHSCDRFAREVSNYACEKAPMFGCDR